MSVEDKVRWDDKYKNAVLPQNVIEVVQNYAKEARGKKALDIACGMGRNAKLLANMDFKVDALDISSVAIESLKGIKNINGEVVDFDTYVLKENPYDLIVCTYFLERKLFTQIHKALKEEGVFIMETFMHDEVNTKVPSNKTFLLDKGELEATFSKNYDIIHLESFVEPNICGDQSMRASIVARTLRQAQ
jgi:2-polyprenyl-3-methyl-5-hydroxy-6-metoxy-1,4-benzoquinol methylase